MIRYGQKKKYKLNDTTTKVVDVEGALAALPKVVAPESRGVSVGSEFFGQSYEFLIGWLRQE